MQQFEKSVRINAIGRDLHVQLRPHEDILAAAYLKFKLEKRLDFIWHESGGAPSLTWFLEWCRQPGTILYAGFLGMEGSDNLDLAGLGWVTSKRKVDTEDYIAEVGMGFFTDFQRNNLPVEFCEMMLDHAFEHLKLIAAYGTTPVPNSAAIRFTRKMGFKFLCNAPFYSSWQGKPCDCQISVMTRQDWFKTPSRSGQVEVEMAEA